MKLLLFLCFVFLNIVVFGQNTSNTDSLKKQFTFYFKILDKEAKKSKADTVFCCRGATSFMEKYTDIESGTMGNILGRYGFTKEALRQWHEWYDKKYRVTPTSN